MSTTILVIGLVMALFFFAYIFLMIFYPEWVGITGKNAMKTMSEHKEENRTDPPASGPDHPL